MIEWLLFAWNESSAWNHMLPYALVVRKLGVESFAIKLALGCYLGFQHHVFALPENSENDSNDGIFFFICAVFETLVGHFVWKRGWNYYEIIIQLCWGIKALFHKPILFGSLSILPTIFKLSNTPLKINMEAENHEIEKEIIFNTIIFWGGSM